MTVCVWRVLLFSAAITLLLSARCTASLCVCVRQKHVLFPQSYKQAIALSPTMVNAHMNLGALLHIRVSMEVYIHVYIALSGCSV